MDALVLVAAVGLIVGDGVVHRVDTFDLVRPVRFVRAVGVGSVSNLRGVDDDPARQLDQRAVTGIADRSGCGGRGGNPVGPATSTCTGEKSTSPATAIDVASLDDECWTVDVPAALANFGVKFTPSARATDWSEASVMK